jgi:peptide/nickel transport system substrate-binding protein
MLLVGAGLLGAAAVAAARGPQHQVGDQPQRGGVLRFGLREDRPSIDPTFEVHSGLTHATQLQLVMFPDTTGEEALRIVPAAAESLPRVSQDGKTYTFTVRRGFRFSNGAPVTARNFAVALDRVLNPKLASFPALFFEEIAGAQAVRDGRAQHASGVTVRGDQLTIRLVRATPDFLARLTMAPASALPLDIPLDPGGVGAPLHSAGPYYVKEWIRGRSALLVRNPYWRRSLLPSRPANVDSVEYRYGLPLAEIVELIERDELDTGSVPREALSDLARRYGVNKGRFFVAPDMSVLYLALNHDGALFRGNVRLRQAMNYAIDRREFVRQLTPFTGSRTDQILMPGLPGYRDWKIYPGKGPDLEKARALARGNLRGGKAVMYVELAGQGVAELLKFNLAKIGLEVDVRPMDLNVMFDRMARREDPWDIAMIAWLTDYPDPQNVINNLFDGGNIRYGDPEATNLTHFDDPVFNERMRRVARLPGPERLEAYARLDRDLMRDAAPIVPLRTGSTARFVSASLGCVMHTPYGFLNIVAVCKKAAPRR